MSTPRPNPYGARNFVLVIDNVVVGSFSDVTGLDSENTPIEYREGGDGTNNVRKYPGMEKHSNVSLKRGITGDLTLWNWRKSVRDSSAFTPPHKDVTIILLNEQSDMNNPAVTFKLRRAWPTKFVGPALSAKSGDMAIEQLDLAHERLDVE
jgi:phage tail-like protein